MRRILTVLLLLTGLAGCASIPTGSEASSLRMAFVRGGDLWLREQGQERLLVKGPDVNAPRFSPDGRFLAFHRGREFVVMGTGGQGPWVVPGVLGAEWSPSESRLAVMSPKGTFIVPVTDQGPGAWQLVTADWQGTVWSPDGKQLAVTRGERSPETHMIGTDWMGIVPAGGGEPRVILKESFNPGQESCGGTIGPHTWSPDGTWLLFVRYGMTSSVSADCNVLAVVSTMGADPVTLAETPRPAWAVWAPDRPSLAYVDGSGRTAWHNKLLRVVAPPWRKPRSLTPAGHADRDPAWHPAGRFLAFTRSEAKMGDGMDKPSPGQAIYRLDTQEGTVTRVAGSEGGFAPFWDKAGGIYWFKPGELWSQQGRLLSDLDLTFQYYGQWDTARIFDTWEP